MSAQNLIEARHEAISKVLDNASTSAEQQARGHLGLAYLFASLNKCDAALLELTASIKALKTKAEGEPNDPIWNFGLAECYNLMAVLDEENTLIDILRKLGSSAD